MVKIAIDIEKALELWTGGWCWGALGRYFDCSGQTVKSRCRIYTDEGKHAFHHKNHNKHCPLCRGYIPSKDQVGLF